MTQQVLTTRKEPGYNYAAHDDAKIRKEKARSAEVRAYGERRLYPRLIDPDYLLLRARRRLLSSWIARLPLALDILDIGGRIQPYRRLFAGREKSYVSLDLQVTGLIDVIGSADQLPFRDECFDVVICTQVLSYVSNPEIVFREAFRVLRPGGALIITAPVLSLPSHDERVRVLANGFTHFLRDYVDVQIEPEVHGAAGICRALAQLAVAASKHPRWTRMKSLGLVAPLNLLGIGAEFVAPHGMRLVPNISAFARRPDAQLVRSA